MPDATLLVVFHVQVRQFSELAFGNVVAVVRSEGFQFRIGDELQFVLRNTLLDESPKCLRPDHELNQALAVRVTGLLLVSIVVDIDVLPGAVNRQLPGSQLQVAHVAVLLACIVVHVLGTRDVLPLARKRYVLYPIFVGFPVEILVRVYLRRLPLIVARHGRFALLPYFEPLHGQEPAFLVRHQRFLSSWPNVTQHATRRSFLPLFQRELHPL